MAAVTWSQLDSVTGSNTQAKGVAAAGTATDAPTLTTEGLALGSVASFDIVLEADSGQTLNGTGTLQCWRYSEAAGAWTRAPGGDITYASITGQRRATIYSGNSPGTGEVAISRRGRIVYNPSSVTVSGGGLTIYLDGSPGGRI